MEVPSASCCLGPMVLDSAQKRGRSPMSFGQNTALLCDTFSRSPHRSLRNPPLQISTEISTLSLAFNLSFSPLFSPLSLHSFYRFFSFFFQSNSKPFLSFPSQFCRLCSPLRSSLFPLSSLFSDFQMLSADSSTCTAWGRSHCVLLLHSAQLSIISLHPIRREQTVSVKVYQRI